MVQHRARHLFAFSGAWILATVAGIVLPVLAVFSLLPVLLPFPASLYGAVVAAIAVATLLAFCQYVVLRGQLGRPSIAVAMWIPISVIAAVAAVGAVALFTFLSTSTPIWSNAVQALLSLGLPLEWLNVALLITPLAALLGIGQGIVLSNVYERNVVGFWLLANLFAALVVGIFYTTMTGFDLVGSLLTAAVYAAVTGPALFVLGSRSGGTAMARPSWGMNR